MRAPHQVLELALTVPTTEVFMCWQLQHMYGKELITFEEFNATKCAVAAAIDNYVTLSGYLRDKEVMPQHMTIHSVGYMPIRNKFYRDLIAKLRAADPMFLIIEAAYHCAYSTEEIHAAVKDHGLPETSDETIANLLGEYSDSIKD